MRRILVPALTGLLVAVLAPLGGARASLLPGLPALPGVPAAAPAPVAPAPLIAPRTGATGHRPAPLRPGFSTALALGLPGLDDLGGGGDDEAGIRDAFPGTGVPKPPPGMSPDVIVDQDRSAMPHNETSVAIDPANPRNILVGANDYSLGFGSSGFYTSFDGGRTFFGGMLPLPSVVFTPPLPELPKLPSPVPPVPKTPIALDGGGDPAVAFDRDGTAYYAEINFHRTGCVGGIFVFRSTNGGQTWSRPLAGDPEPGDTRRPGDGVVAVNSNDHDCQLFFDKEYIATGPRPAGVAVDPRADREHLSSDRLYVVYSQFAQEPPGGIGPYAGPLAGTGSPTMLSYSDDQGRTWSRPVYIDGASRTLCTAGLTGSNEPPSPLPQVAPPLGLGLPPGPLGVDECIDSQGAVPAVDPRTGAVHVAFFNGDNPLCLNGQVLVTASADGGATWSAEPSQAACMGSPLPAAGDQACPKQPAGQEILSGYCFRVPTATGQTLAVNPVDGSVHVVWQDNRNGGKDWDAAKPGARVSDLDIFTVASTDGGRTWGGPVRVNQDPVGDHRDQFFPWGAFGPDGTFYVSFLDRAPDLGGGPPGASFQLLDPGGRLIGRSLAVSHDDGSTFTSRVISSGLFDGNLGFREGAFLGDYTGMAAGRLGSFSAWPDTRRAGARVQGDNPADAWSDIAGYASVPGGSAPLLGSAPATGVTAPTRPAPRPPVPGPARHAPAPAAAPVAPVAAPVAPAAAPAGLRIADVLGGFLCGVGVMAGSSLGRRRRRRRRR